MTDTSFRFAPWGEGVVAWSLMRTLILLSTALLIVGCGEKSSSEDQETGPDSRKSSSAKTKRSTAATNPVASAGEKGETDTVSISKTSRSLSDAEVERLADAAIESLSLQERDGRVYQSGESRPYSGWAKRRQESGGLAYLGHYKDGKFDGSYTEWHPDGKKKREESYKNGIPHGSFTEWHKSGEKKLTYISENGITVGTVTWWHENGQKRLEYTSKGGKKDGLSTEWHDNGQKSAEVNFEDGNQVSATYWNRDGEEIPASQEPVR